MTKDDCPVIFHDDFILSKENVSFLFCCSTSDPRDFFFLSKKFSSLLKLWQSQGSVFEKRVTELCLSEFLSYGPQKEPGKQGKTLLRKTKYGKIVEWDVEQDDSLCTLQEAFERVEPTLGFNIELKFDDHIVYQHDHLTHVLQAVLEVQINFFLFPFVL